MPVPSTIADLSTVAADNSPQGSEPIGTSLDNYIRAGFAFVKQIYNMFPVSLENGGTGGVSASSARTNLGLGTAATLNVGTAASNVVQLTASGDMPAVPGVLPPSTVIFVATASAPVGFLKANGALVSRTTYAALFAAIGTTFGSGDGSTTFALPDLRGEFLRALDDGRGVDAARVRGSAQADQLQNIVGSVNNLMCSPATEGTGALSAVLSGSPGAFGSAYKYATVTFDASAADGVRAGSETRPRNIALLACIKY